ncbi:anion permease [Tenacibaculum maritimum]|uniref:Phosphate transporter n=1 Tax=Tenacibaculum maritimum NCIMB 2154 TaxID=1349785 RepID=A0A2H1ECY7_9FLAO|nr:inorganic phosphate transporter [Tenacibaculum maritimum]MDB0601253.1 inorganic phosphate transporter [Tenacibaculum maritimum]MDB0611293.1 inorganic phosphate transporter [Tenacibaculum maritimum]CAA0173699.1 Phosphate transporter [Tenacibaculum maritimum]CAA0182997.1 Phosphate transporter [Tenacibaculum maritimum]CAA0245215.1 Phosphate transporter [Tenacibaculum maritimum]
MILLLLFIAACFLAYSNGANDNFKGVATLFGAGITNYKKAINWATITTFSGSVAAIFLAKELVKNFSGKGLVPNELIQTPNFAIAIALGAALTVFAATKIGMPISTTHGLVGGLFGAGVMAVGSDFNFGKLGNTFLMPLVVSPLMAAILSLLAYLLFKFIKKQIPSLHTKNPTLFGISAPKILDRLHYLSAGIVSFARGLNDTPKIVGLLIIINTIDIKWSMISVAVIMSLGGLLNAKKVGETMSKKITKMNSGQGFTANIVTGLLVTTASVHGLPVSTTHVSVGSLFGIGTATKKADYKVIGKIILSWVLTLPIAAIMSAVIFKVLQVVA